MTDPGPDQPQQPGQPQRPVAPGTPQQPTAPLQPTTPQQPTAPLQPTTPQQPTVPLQPPVNPNETAVQPPGVMPQTPAAASPPPGYPSGEAPPSGSAPPGFPAAGAESNQAVSTERPFAGFGSRLIGQLVDLVITGLLYTVVLVGLAAFTFPVDTEPAGCDLDLDAGCQVSGAFTNRAAISLFILAIFWLAMIFFYFIRPIAKTGQTVGRRVANVRVVDEQTGEPPSMGKAIVRYLVASIISGAIFWLGYLWMLWDDKNQTWHDKLAGTIVVGE